jgi:hypothetical protein
MMMANSTGLALLLLTSTVLNLAVVPSLFGQGALPQDENR